MLGGTGPGHDPPTSQTLKARPAPQDPSHQIGGRPPARNARRGGLVLPSRTHLEETLAFLPRSWAHCLQPDPLDPCHPPAPEGAGRHRKPSRGEPPSSVSNPPPSAPLEEILHDHPLALAGHLEAADPQATQTPGNDVEQRTVLPHFWDTPASAPMVWDGSQWVCQGVSRAAGYSNHRGFGRMWCHPPSPQARKQARPPPQ